MYEQMWPIPVDVDANSVDRYQNICVRTFLSLTIFENRVKTFSVWHRHATAFFQLVHNWATYVTVLLLLTIYMNIRNSLQTSQLLQYTSANLLSWHSEGLDEHRGRHCLEESTASSSRRSCSRPEFPPTEMTQSLHTYTFNKDITNSLSKEIPQ